MDERQRALLVRIRGLLLLAIDLIDRECKLGKYADVTFPPTIKS